ncbi:hypothetical protein GCM10010403_51640 [Glycomyces rutgersensis]|uniref:Mycothiol system anti-sigma-R factor n=2 Tax=Glycomyces TaxID=58113 RepID=A0A9X3PNI6_9ACTN|nr:mycothiol system anti-sigma-R factor [Glycomyces lechevalierae]MDA1387116.1 mycothiol system anti-sigma-R factor [Glycomyces lechevalierae]MDR7336747.1 mycothiol system anti-sigma-R factor [Glycomyces lechevalierae]
MTTELEKPRLDCREVLEEVYLYLDEECSDRRRAVIRDHLEECSPCLAEYGIEQEVRAIVHRCCSREKAPDEVKTRAILGTHDSEEHERRRKAEREELMRKAERDQTLDQYWTIEREALLNVFQIEREGRTAKMRKRLQGLRRQQLSALIATVAGWIGGPAGEGRRAEWSSDLHNNSRPIRYAFGFVRAALLMRVNSSLCLLLRGLCWGLASDVRTWTPFAIVLVGAAFKTAVDQGPWIAILTILAGAQASQWAVNGLRRGLRVKPRKRQPGASEPES